MTYFDTQDPVAFPEFVNTNDRILHFLSAHKTGVLSTVDPNGSPHASVIYYSIDSFFTIRFQTKRRTQKNINLSNNNHAALVVFDEPSQTTVQITGVASEITDEAKASRVFRTTLRASLGTSQSGIPPLAKLNAGDYVAYELKPQDVRMADYGRWVHGTHETIFEVAELPSEKVL